MRTASTVIRARRFAVAAIVAVVASTAAGVRPRAQTGGVPAPSEFLKIKVGGDGVLASYDQIASYIREVARLRPDRVMVEDLGPTTMGHPMLNAIITSPENMKRLDFYRDLNARLYDPRRTNEADAARLIPQAKTIVAMQMSIHSTEVAAAQVSMELAYRFATEDTPRMKAVLDNCIILLTPSHNPDGTQMVAEWNQKTAGTKFEGSNVTVPVPQGTSGTMTTATGICSRRRKAG